MFRLLFIRRKILVNNLFFAADYVLDCRLLGIRFSTVKTKIMPVVIALILAIPVLLIMMEQRKMLTIDEMNTHIIKIQTDIKQERLHLLT